jgi:hypothetical protein
MTKKSLRTLLLRAAKLLEVAAERAPSISLRCVATAKELRDAALKGIRA